MEYPKRFSCVHEASGLWMVWDGTLSTPAMLDGCVLDGRSGERAESACALLERIYKNHLDASSVRAAGLLELCREQDHSRPPKG